ncbi:polysaccharide biosynthesis tyrosine autokinase [Nguyenibacter vanlangensis]|uniref:non-specific protein-tyrosine kinase n=1 Tax=Nguyenibacter vanlangensis TaxID=1216886 RepID=A0ABZ3D7X8_9PROT
MNQLQLPPLNGPLHGGALGGMPSGATEAQPSAARIFSMIGRHRLAVALVTLGLGAPAITGIALLKPYYTATTMLMIGTRGSSFRDLQATVSAPDIDTIAVNTQVDVLRSPAIARTVVDRLDLLHDPEFTSLLDTVPLKQRIMDEIYTLLGSPPKAMPPLTPEQRAQALALILAGKVTILNDGRSYMIKITAKTGNPVTSARIANAYADSYLDFRRHLKVAATWQANALLDEQIVPLRERLRKAEQAVEQFRERNGLITARLDHQPGTAEAEAPTVADEQLQRMNQELVTAQADLEMKRARYSEVQNAIRTGTVGSLPDVVSAPLIQQLQGQEAQLSSRVSSLSQTALGANPDLQAAEAGAAQVRREIGAVTGRIAASVTKDLSGAEARVAALSRAVANLQRQVSSENQADVTLQQLESEANAARVVYQDYLGRFAQTSTQAQLQEPEAELISRAAVPLGVSGPPRTQYGAIAVVFSVLAGIGSALLIDRARGGIRSTSQLDSVPGLFTLGMVPTFSGALAQHYRSVPTSSIYVETVEAIRSILSFGHSRFRAKVVLVTSARPGEGKTTFAVSLAANAGRAMQRALVIDCDTRNPSAAAIVSRTDRTDRTANSRLPAHIGKDGLLREVLPGVDILTVRPASGRNNAMVSPLELNRILAQFSGHYDMIVVDTPPVLAFPDAPVLAQQTDGVVMVVKWGLTDQGEVNEAMRILHAYDARVLGGVLTQVVPRDLDVAERRQMATYRQYYLATS